MVSRIYGLADARRSMPSAVRVGKHRMSGAVAHALWLRSQKFFHSFFLWALGMIPSNFRSKFGEQIWEKNFPPPQIFLGQAIGDLVCFFLFLCPVIHCRSLQATVFEISPPNFAGALDLMPCPNRKSYRFDRCIVA